MVCGALPDCRMVKIFFRTFDLWWREKTPFADGFCLCEGFFQSVFAHALTFGLASRQVLVQIYSQVVRLIGGVFRAICFAPSQNLES